MKKFLIIIFCLCSFNSAFSGRLDKGFERLSIYDYFAAKEHFYKSLKKHPAAASYGLSIIYGRNDNPFFNLDSARVHILNAGYEYVRLSEKQKRKYSEFGVSDSSIVYMQDSICSKAFNQATSFSSVERFNIFIERFSFCRYLDEAIDLRNEVAFEEARRLNTSAAYKTFMDTYPDAEQFNDAFNRFQERQFEEETSSRSLTSYVRFIEKHPDSPYRTQAERMVYQLSTSSKNIKDYLAFIRRYPDNRFTAEAWREVYKISMEEFNEQTFLKFKYDYPDYPFKDELENDYRLQTSVFLPFRENGKWGYMNELGELMIQSQYDEVNLFSEGLASVSKDGKFGYINKSGQTIIPFQFNDAERFQNNTAIVRTGDKYGMISRSGEFIIPANYDELSEASEGFCVAILGGKAGYIHKPTRKALTDFAFISADDFKDGYAIVENDEGFGLINVLGKFSIEPRYEEMTWAGTGLLKASLNEYWGLLSTVGRVIVPFQYDAIGEMTENRILLVKNGRCGFADETGNILIPVTYRFTEKFLQNAYFRNGYVKLNDRNKIFVLDSLGKRFQISGYENNGMPSENLIPVQRNRKWGYADLLGKIKIPTQFLDATSFNEGLAIVRTERGYGVIDSGLVWIVPAQFDDIKVIPECIITRKQGKSGIYSRSGKLLAEATYDRVDFIEGKVAWLQADGNSTYINLEKSRIIFKRADSQE
ncbi:MAG: WG repeat-containing protein [Bacteroidetes bacterium]|nr:MAG: WG repeat-containing protein [Bacteroidota bacterium]REK00667.1 MAG: WG repeat-containing protein [Bacteroidota bacterium]REK35211.1 MAG: WG repeat-containing protein [Bacteroidota bacterium]REK48288.1 MAG: WG repeat-containing protein [Bacteroidota bacterium]